MIPTVDLLLLDADELAERLEAWLTSEKAQRSRDRWSSSPTSWRWCVLRPTRRPERNVGLLEVSGGILRALARFGSGQGRGCPAPLRFAQEDGGAACLGPLANGLTIDADALAALGEQGRERPRSASCVRFHEIGSTCARSLRSARARTSSSRPPSGLGDESGTARGLAGLGTHDDGTRRRVLASESECTQQQAALHLEAHHPPLSGHDATRQTIPPVTHKSDLHVIYARATPATSPSQDDERDTKVVVGGLEGRRAGRRCARSDRLRPVLEPRFRNGLERKSRAKLSRSSACRRRWRYLFAGRTTSG